MSGDRDETGTERATARTLAVQGEGIAAPRLDHFRRTLDELSRARPDLPFLGELRDALNRLRPDGVG